MAENMLLREKLGLKSTDQVRDARDSVLLPARFFAISSSVLLFWGIPNQIGGSR